jgi:hypothetical protein
MCFLVEVFLKFVESMRIYNK